MGLHYFSRSDVTPPPPKKKKKKPKKKKKKKKQQTNKQTKITKRWIPFKRALRPLRLQMNSFIKIKATTQVKFDISTKKNMKIHLYDFSMRSTSSATVVHSELMYSLHVIMAA